MGNIKSMFPSHETLETLKNRCTYVQNLPNAEKCDFIYKLGCDSESDLIEYHSILFCMIPLENQYIYTTVVILLFLLFILVFYYLAVTVDQFFCPAIGVISDILRLSENLSGVTLLALGNGLPDILSSMISSAKGSTILMNNQLLGGSMFVTCLIAGTIAYVRPFYLQVYPFLRDMLFIIVTVSYVVHIDNKEITKYDGFVFFGIYVCYLSVAIGGFIIQNSMYKEHCRTITVSYHLNFLRYLGAEQQNKIEYVDWTELRRPCVINENDIQQILLSMKSRRLSLDSEEDVEEYESYFREFWNDLKTFSKEEWEVMTRCAKILIITQTPLLITLKLFIPIVCFGSPRNGWCKLLNSLNIALYPMFIALSLKLQIQFYEINLYFILGPAGLLLGVLVFLTSKKDTQPPYHIIFAFLNLFGSMVVIFKLVKEVVAILNLFGTVCGIESQTLALTILAWGNGLGDAITNIALAKRGFQRMAFSGCFAGSLATMCLSFGLSITMTKDTKLHMRSGLMGPVCNFFLLANLTYSLLFMLLTHFRARKSYGFFLIFVYAEFLIFCILNELNIVHPFGSDHGNEADRSSEQPEKAATTNLNSIV